MAANYSQYTDHNEIGGVSVGLEDAKLAAADSVDEVTATDCVLMKDASGNPVKILKEDFNEAVRDALGSILSNSELGTSIGRVAALRSSDNDFGSISTSDLASVLGVTGIANHVKSFSVIGTYDTGISVNAQHGGRALLAIASGNHGDGDNTGSLIAVLRCGFSGNNLSTYEISKQGPTSSEFPLSISTSANETIVLNTSIETVVWNVVLISSKPF